MEVSITRTAVAMKWHRTFAVTHYRFINLLACYERKSSAAAPFVCCIILLGHIALLKLRKVFLIIFLYIYQSTYFFHSHLLLGTGRDRGEGAPVAGVQCPSGGSTAQAGCSKQSGRSWPGAHWRAFVRLLTAFRALRQCCRLLLQLGLRLSPVAYLFEQGSATAIANGMPSVVVRGLYAARRKQVLIE